MILYNFSQLSFFCIACKSRVSDDLRYSEYALRMSSYCGH